MKVAGRCAAVVAWMGLAASSASAQVGAISVTVLDADERPLAGATVTVGSALGFVKTTAQLTDRQGRVEFPVLRSGEGYSIVIACPGFGTTRYDDLRVPLGQTLALVVSLVAAIEEQVSVSTERPVVDLSEAEATSRFRGEFIRDLPVAGRFYRNVLTMAPGVQDANGDGNPNVHGARSRDFQTVISGVNDTDPLTGRWMSRVNPNSIEELEVITAGAGVEFGRAQGGFARVIQKQGSNVHEGVFEFYYNTSSLDGGHPDAAVEGVGFDTYHPLVQVSGPVVRDRVWYRVSGEWEDREDPIDVVAGLEVYGKETRAFDAQLTFQASPRNKVALQIRADEVEEHNFGVSSSVPPESALARGSQLGTYALNWTAPYSPKVLVESTLAWQDADVHIGPAVEGMNNDCLPRGAPLFLRRAYCENLDTGRVSGSYYQNEDDRRQRLTARGQATIHAGRFLGATHQFKTGLSIENERYFRTVSRAPRVDYEVKRIPTFFFPIEVGVSHARLATPDVDDARATGTSWGLYFEDQLRPAASLTLTLGARLDRDEIATEGWSAFDPIAELDAFEGAIDDGDMWWLIFPETFTGYEEFELFEAEMQELLCAGVPATFIGQCLNNVAQQINSQNHEQLVNKRRAVSLDMTNTNVSPYLALSWSPWSNGKTAFKAAAGRHYNSIPLIVPLQGLEPTLSDVVFRTFVAGGSTTLHSPITPVANVETVDPEMSTPYQDELMLSFERELWPETALALTYVSRRFRDQIQDVASNLDTGDYGRCVAQSVDSPATILESWGGGVGSGQILEDPYTKQTYEDTDPGRGDGRVDDCVGNTFDIDTSPFFDPFGDDIIELQRPDGLSDLYFQNPFWGDIFVVGNFNEIDYEAYVLSLVRRQYRGWEMNASYTWSRAEGDGEDFFQELGNDPTLNVAGFQSYDQRHVVKLNATVIAPWGLRFGSAVTWQSGLPYSIVTDEPSDEQLPTTTVFFGGLSSRIRQLYPTGARNDLRNDGYWNVDLMAVKSFHLGRGTNFQLSAEVFNALDDETYMVYNPFFERGQNLNGVNEAQRRFGRRWQVGVRLSY